jgi:pantothenate kinase
MSIEHLFVQIQTLLQSPNPRSVIGIVGKPGAGKSTVVSEIEKRFDSSQVSVIPMDGYHLSNEELIALGRRDRKGAPDTFDTQSFISLITKVKNNPELEHRFPIFHREIEASIENEGSVPSNAKIIVVEGNYLFSEELNWQGVFPLLDHTWFIEIDDEVRIERLIARHIRFGKTLEAAENWSRGSDEANARFIAKTASKAKNLISL